jgi:hypothetical protein
MKKLTLLLLVTVFLLPVVSGQSHTTAFIEDFPPLRSGGSRS